MKELRWFGLMAVVFAAGAMFVFGPSSVSSLIEDLKHEEVAVRRNAATTLGNYGSRAEKAIPALKDAVHDKNFAVRVLAGVALTRLGETEGEVEISPFDIPMLIPALGDKEGAVRDSAEEGLEKLGIIAVPALAKALQDKDSSVRRGAVKVLFHLGPQAADAAPALADALKTGETGFQQSIVVALGQLGPAGAPAVPQLLDAAGWVDSHCRSLIFQTLGQIGPRADAAVPAAIEALGDESRSVRSQAATALSKFGPSAKDAIPALADVLSDDHFLVRMRAAEAIVTIGPDRQVLPQLIAALEDSDQNVRGCAAKALAQLGDAAVDAVPALTRKLEDPNESDQVRVYSANALGNIGPAASGSVGALIETLRSESSRRDRLSRSASTALTGIGEPAVGPLVELLQSDDFVARKSAAKVLYLMGPKAHAAVPALVEALGDYNLREPAIEALGQIGKPAVPALIDALGDNSKRRDWEYAARALAAIGPEAREAVPALIDMFQHSNTSACRFAADALVNIGQPALPPLHAFYTDTNAKRSRMGHLYAGSALKRLDPQAAAEAGVR